MTTILTTKRQGSTVTNTSDEKTVYKSFPCKIVVSQIFIAVVSENFIYFAKTQ